MPAFGSRAPTFHESRLLLLLVASSIVHLGCLDLTIPPDREAGGGALPIGSPDLDPSPNQTGGQGGSGQLGSSSTLPNDARELGGATELPPSGSGGIVAAGAGGDSAISTAASGGSGGKLGTIAGGNGGAGGETAAGRDSATVVPEGDGGTPGRRDGASDVFLSSDADAAATVAPSSVPTMGLVAYYACEQAEGTMLRDQSGNANHGTLATALGAGGRVGPAGAGYRFESGKIGNGLTLVQAGGGYVRLPVAMFQDAADITISTWIRLNSLTTWQRVFDVGINAHLKQNPMTGTVYSNLALKDINHKLDLNSTTNGYGGEQRITVDVFPTGVWKHLAVVLGNGNAALYVDGTVVGLATSLPTLQALGALDYAFIGRSQFTSDPPLDGQIDEFRVYNRALSANEIEALFEYAGP